MTINALIQTERPPISNLVNGLRESDLFVDDTFQRRLVWTEKQKVRLVETILMGFPMPEIYLWQQPADAESGKQRKSVVDGQQRLTTMRQFVSNEWPLHVKYLDEQNQKAEYAGKLWKDLTDQQKQVFWDYVVNTRIIPNTIKKETIISLFKRLNETDKSLNPQEIRNAEFNGAFIEAAEVIADFQFWEKHSVFNANLIRRMADIEFASSLLIFLRKGSVQETDELLNSMYDLYNDEYAERDADIKSVSQFVDWLDAALASRNELKVMFSKPVHIFSLFCVREMLSANNLLGKLSVPALVEFVAAYESRPEGNELIASYRTGATARTRSKASRDARSKALYDWLAGGARK